MFYQIKNLILTYKKQIGFIFVGVTTGIIFFGTIFILRDLFAFRNEIPFTLSYIISVSYHFIMNKLFVFKEKKIRTVINQIPKYIILVSINYLINLGIVKISRICSINYYIGISLGILITFLFTYFILNKIIFKLN